MDPCPNCGMVDDHEPGECLLVFIGQPGSDYRAWLRKRERPADTAPGVGPADRVYPPTSPRDP